MTLESESPAFRHWAPLLLSLLVAGALLLNAARPRAVATSEALVPLAADLPQPNSGEVPLELDAPAVRGEKNSLESQAARSREATVLTCLRANTGEGLAGVHLYNATRPIAGPSAESGAMEAPPTLANTMTLWVEGWQPVRVPAGALPSEASFQVADTLLEVRVLNATYDHRFVNSSLQAHAAWPAADGPWAPALLEQSLDLYTAKGVMPGKYDLYLWIKLRKEEPRCYSRMAISIEAGQTQRLTIDLGTPADAAEADSDS